MDDKDRIVYHAEYSYDSGAKRDDIKEARVLYFGECVFPMTLANREKLSAFHAPPCQ
jgi:hypothetical protein